MEGADTVAAMEVTDMEVLLRVEVVREKVLEGAPLLSERELELRRN